MENIGSSNTEHDENFPSNSIMENVKRKYDGVEPFEGMLFESIDAVHSFYHLYAQNNGFTVRIRNSTTFPRSKEIRYRRYTCSYKGSSEQNSDVDGKKKTPASRAGCLATISVSRKKLTDYWMVKDVKNVHNHVLANPRDISNVMASIRKNLVEKRSKAELPKSIVNDESGNTRKINLDSGDAVSAFNYCRKKEFLDPYFYFNISHDNESRMVNFFWADCRARLCYERFGDVVVFDSTYKTNKYGLPLGLFIGVNNNLQSVLFGCALLQDGTEESYEWLFKTWLEAMNGKAPRLILTDQNSAIENMVKKVFPSSTHRLCLWHIMKKFPEKYGNLYRKELLFKKDLKRCLYQSVTSEEFEREWDDVMSRYNLAGETWVQQIFEIRTSWVPWHYITEFVAKFDQALLSRYKDENRVHCASKHNIPETKTWLSDHAAIVYTRNIFTLFEDEDFESYRFKKEKLDKHGSFRTYLVSHYENPNPKFKVSVSTMSWDASCECRLFEFRGILCRHILAIFQRKEVHKIPPQYILPRWTKEAADGIPIPLALDADKSALIRISEFRRKMSLLMPYLHKSDEMYRFIMDAMAKLLEKVQKLESSTDEAVGESSNGRQKKGLEIGTTVVAKKQKVLERLQLSDQSS